MLSFERLSIKNFLSYGNIPTVIELNTHAKTLICSPNGMGKCLHGDTQIQVKPGYHDNTYSICLKDLFNQYRGISPGLKHYNSDKLRESYLIGDLYVETDSGFVPIQAVHQTIPLEVYRLTTKFGYRLDGSADHPVFVSTGEIKLLKDLILGVDNVLLRTGTDVVISVDPLGFSEPLYDISVCSKTKSYYANQILSHNTAIPTALLFGLFGKTHRKVNLPQLVNAINGGDCEVEVWFSSGPINHYHIRRGLKPSFLEITHNGTPVQSTTITDLQQLFETQILKTDFKTFSSIITIGGKNQIPFMVMKKQERRQIIESLLDIDIFTLMNLISKNHSSELQESIHKKRSEIGLQEQLITLLKENIKRAKKLIEESIESTQKTLANYQEQLDQIVVEKQQIESELKSIQDTFGHIQSLDTSFTSKHQKMLSKQTTLKKRIETITKNKEFYELNDSCPSCSQPLELNYKLKSIQECQQQLENTQGELSQLQILITELLNLHKEVKVNLTRFSDFLFKRNQLQQEEEKLISIMKALDIPQDRVIINSIVEDEQQLNGYYEQLLTLRNELELLQEQQEYLDFCQVLLKDDGIKTLIIKEYIPRINSILNQFLDNLDLFIDFNFDEQFSESIKSRNRELFSYDSFSDGQKMRIDIALLFTWREIAKQRNSLNTNILFCDELFDSSLDVNATELAIHLLNVTCKNICCFVISHKSELFESKMDRILQLSLENNFTQIKEVI